MTNDTKGLMFSPPLADFIAARKGAYYTTLSGGNNSGKSVVLKEMKNQLGRIAYMAGPQRFYHVTELPTQRFNRSDYDDWDNNFRSQSQQNQVNYEHNVIELGRIIGGLKDDKRQKLFKLAGDMIGTTFTLQRSDPENELSPRYVDMDGQSLAVASSGTRLLITLLGLCMDDEFQVILIDEPELGLSPRLQAELSRLFNDKQRRAEHFPQLSGVFVATHSHLMLDKQDISNNFTVTRDGRNVVLSQLATPSDLHHLQFNMLGNSLEDLFLPSAIVICEGKTDQPFIERVLRFRHPGRRILVIESQGDVKRAFKNLANSLGDIRKSPFQDRTFVVLDSIHTQDTRTTLEALGAKPENIVVWDKNGIEYVYPPTLLCKAFTCGNEAIGGMTTEQDNVIIGAVSIRKVNLAEQVVGDMQADTVQSEELVDKLIIRITNAIG